MMDVLDKEGEDKAVHNYYIRLLRILMSGSTVIVLQIVYIYIYICDSRIPHKQMVGILILWR